MGPNIISTEKPDERQESICACPNEVGINFKSSIQSLEKEEIKTFIGIFILSIH